jgi:hypothetical protein
VILAEESGLDDADAQEAVAWAIDALVSTLLTAQPADRIAPEKKP